MRRALPLLACAACWTGAPVESPAPAPAPVPACRLREHDVEPARALALALEGEVFARVVGELVALDVLVRDPHASRTRLENAYLVLEGELDLGAHPLRPRDPDHEGWVEVHAAYVRRVRGGTARLEVPLPEGVAPSSVTIDRRCAELTITAAPEPELPDGTERVQLAPGTSVLRRSPNGAALAELASAGDDPLHVQVVERRGGAARVRLADENVVTGWLDATRLEPILLGGLMGGLIGDAVFHDTLRCPGPVAVFVRSRRRGVVRVGTIKARTAMRLVKPRAAATAAELAIDLHGDTLQPFVRAGDVKGCR